jgi:hypothetical protein
MKLAFATTSFLAVFAVAASTGYAQDAPAKLNLNDPNIVFVEESVIPIPLEIFSSLDKLGARDWSGQIVNREVNLDPDRSRTAILFGLVVSEGFIAVQAKDNEGVRRIGREVLRLAQPLNVLDDVQSHANAIITGAGKNDWDSVRGERDKDLVALVSLGGWLGGTEALSAVLKDDYSPEASDLLNQPDLVTQLKSDFNGLPRRVRRGDLFSEVSKTLTHLEFLMRNDASGSISKGNVIEISLATKNLVNAIYGG